MIQVNRIYLIFNRLVTKKFLVDTSVIIWIIGVVLCVKAVLEIMKWPVDGVKKLLVAIIILLTSWIGICVYYFWGRENLPQILK